jgi:predicted nucleic acid-binding protein
MVKRLVVDASVAVKWLVPLRPEEADVPQALALMAKLDAGEISLHQPPHFVAEVMGVISRICPEEAPGILYDLLNTEMCGEESSAIYATATQLSVQLKHHLFDTLYHATALHIPGATCVTADAHYYAKARDFGQITLLAHLDLPR